MLKIVKAMPEEKDTAMGFINEAKKFLKESGVDQWQNGYPEGESIENDIVRENGYFIDEDGDHIGYMCIDFNGEPAYEQLCGNWLNEEKYIVIHRMAMSVDGRGKGLAQKAFELAGELALINGVSNIRVDTDADNMIMKHILSKCGFTYCGTVWFDNSEKIAFQKKL